jgi:hypothetical protein
MESLVSYASLLVEKSNMTSDEATEQRKIESRKKIDPLKNAQEICMRYLSRGKIFPCRWVDRQNDPVKEQEFKDALKLTRWKLALKGNRTGYGICSDEVRDYLDAEMKGWRDDVMKRSASLKHAQDITRRYVIRGNTLPRPLLEKDCTDSIRVQEHKDYKKLLQWHKALKGTGRKCPVYIFQYLDKEIPEWADVARFRIKVVNNSSTKSSRQPNHVKMMMNESSDITLPVEKAPVEKIKVVNNVVDNLSTQPTSSALLIIAEAVLPDDTKSCEGNPSRQVSQPSINGETLISTSVINATSITESRKRGYEEFLADEIGALTSNTSNAEVTTTTSITTTTTTTTTIAAQSSSTVKTTSHSSSSEKNKRYKVEPLVYAQEIVQRYRSRYNVFPCRWVDRQNDPVKEQEFKDALKLTRWKLALKGNRTGYGVCSDEVRDYLDAEMPGWRGKRSTSK